MYKLNRFIKVGSLYFTMKEVKFRIDEEQLKKLQKDRGKTSWRELALLGAEYLKIKKKK